MITIDLLQFAAVAVLVTMMLAGLGLAGVSLLGRQRMRELAYRERIAMIEKGLVPSPETDPAGFEAMLAPRSPSVKAIRYRTGGVILSGLGLAYTVLIFFIVPDIRRIALGVGGFLTVLGLTSLFNGLLLAGDDVDGIRRTNRPRG